MNALQALLGNGTLRVAAQGTLTGGNRRRKLALGLIGACQAHRVSGILRVQGENLLIQGYRLVRMTLWREALWLRNELSEGQVRSLRFLLPGAPALAGALELAPAL